MDLVKHWVKAEPAGLEFGTQPRARQRYRHDSYIFLHALQLWGFGVPIL